MADETKKEDAVVEEKATEEVKETAPAVEEAPAAEAKEEKATEIDETVEVPKEFKKLVEEVENMSVLQLNELVKVLEKRFGVSAAAVAVAGPAGDAGGAEEKDEFSVELTEAGASKIGVIKAVKGALGLGLKEAKELVDGAPTVLKEGMKKEDAETLKTELEAAGATVTLK